MRIAPQSLRWRLQVWHGLLLFIVICAFGFSAYQLEKIEEQRTVDNDLQHRLSALVNALRAPPGQRPPGENQRPRPPGPNLKFTPEVAALFGPETGCYYAIWMRGPEPVARSDNAPTDLPRPEPGDEISRTRDESQRETFVFAAPVDCVLVGRSIVDEQSLLFAHASLLAGSGAVLLILGLLGGAWLVARALKPVEDISKTAAQIAAGDLSQRIPAVTTGSELGRVVRVLNTTFAQLDAAFSQQARFTADAAHELRTPVTVLLSETQSSLARERSASEYRESLETCQRVSQRMRRLIERLLDLARIEVGPGVLQCRKCDLAVIAAQCLGEVSTLARDHNVSTTADLSLAPCHGDPDRLAQVITNLLANAIQHTRPGGSIRITTASDRKTVSLVVADTGSGIEPDDLPHVFERFYRADKARESSAGHAGLGLSIAKAIVAAHGGSIEVESELRHGATFSVVLPCHED